MSLRRTVAAPFRQQGVDRMAENEFVVAVSLDRDWFSPDQAKTLVDVATGKGLLRTDGEDLVPTFEPRDVTVPEGFAPDEAVVQERSPFERVLDALVDDGAEKQDAVAAINRLQADLGLTIDAAAVLYAHRQGIDVRETARRALEEC
ncbi:MAG: DUF2240 family protein [Haloarculaceae archaeon]